MCQCAALSMEGTSAAAQPRARLSRGGLRWALDGLVLRHLRITRIAEALGVSWNTANDAVLADGRRVLIDDPHRFDGVRVIGVDDTSGATPRRAGVRVDATPWLARVTVPLSADEERHGAVVATFVAPGVVRFRRC